MARIFGTFYISAVVVYVFTPYVFTEASEEYNSDLDMGKSGGFKASMGDKSGEGKKEE